MNILYIAHRIPYPPDKGDKIRSFHQIRYLSRKHSVYLACLIDDKEDLQHIETLKEYCVAIDAVFVNQLVAKFKAVAMLLGKKPLSVAFFQSEQLRKKICRRIHDVKFDRIIIFSSAMAEYVRDILDIPKLIDFVDVDSEKWRGYADSKSGMMSWIYRLEARRLAEYEEDVAKAFSHSILVSQAEASLLQRRVKGRPVSVVPNGVDLDYFNSSDGSLRCDLPVIVFAGTMDYFPNVDAVTYFCEEIFPLIRNASPDAQFYIVGRNPTRVVRELNRQPGVIVTGSVQDVRPYLAKAWLAVAPFRVARGVQNKVLEALAMGLPIVGTYHAFQGIEATSENGIRLVDDPQKFGQEVIRFFKDEEMRRTCSLLGREYVEKHHRWESQGVRLEALLQNLH